MGVFCFFWYTILGMNSSNIYFPLSAFLNALTSFVLGLYVILTNHNKRVVRYIFYFCLAVGFWSLGYFFWQISTTYDSAFFWSRALMLAAIFTPIAYFHLVLVFLDKDKEKFYKMVLKVSFFFSFLWIIVDFTPFFVKGLVARSFFKFWPVAGIFYLPYLIYFFALVFYASVLLFLKFRKSSGAERMQTVLLLLGILLAFVGGSTNYPLWYDINLPPWGNGLVMIYVILTVYAIMKYKFLEIKAVFAELFTGFLVILLSIDTFFSTNITELLFRLFVVLITLIFGIVLIRSVRREIERREEITKLAQSLEQANLRLQEIDRQKTDFLSIASHQLRTPLSIANGYIELLHDGAYGKIPKQAKEILSNMDESNGRLVKLVDEFLDITRIEQGRTKFDFKVQDINDIIDSAVKELDDRAVQKGLKLVWHRPTTAAAAAVDDEKIRHVVFNFIDNAIKYSDKGRIVVEIVEKDKGWSFTVRDHGFGFGRVDEANFFQKFYRGENVKGSNVTGTGIGLYVCRMFIEGHGGHVWAHSEGLGKGSEFGFWVPKEHEEAKKVEKKS